MAEEVNLVEVSRAHHELRMTRVRAGQVYELEGRVMWRPLMLNNMYIVTRVFELDVCDDDGFGRRGSHRCECVFVASPELGPRSWPVVMCLARDRLVMDIEDCD